MTKKIYKSSIYDKALYGTITSGILILGLWAMFFGIEKRVYNLPLLIIDLLFCVYSIVILIRLFSYRVAITDQFIKIYDFNKTICIYYQNIIDIKISGSVCYIIDRISADGNFFVRGTNIAPRYSRDSSISINAARVPSIRRAYLEGYNEIIETLLLKCGMEYSGEVALSGIRKSMSYNPIKALLLIEYTHSKKEFMQILAPCLLIMLTFVLSLLVFGTAQKGLYYPWILISLKSVFILYIAAAVYIFIIRFIPIVKKIAYSKSEKEVIDIKSIAISLLMNTLVFAAVIIFVPYIIKNYG